MLPDELLDQCSTQYRSLIERVKAASEGLSAEQLNHKPAQRDWSLAQILQHVWIANNDYIPLIEAALSKALPTHNPGEVRYSWLGRTLMRVAGPSGNAPAPKPWRPPEGPYTHEVIDKWITQHKRLLELAEKAKGLDLSSIRIRNPLIRLLKMNLADCFKLFAEHGERHVRQIEAAIQGR